jgi:hypothetical protein
LSPEIKHRFEKIVVFLIAPFQIKGLLENAGVRRKLIELIKALFLIVNAVKSLHEPFTLSSDFGLS